MTSLNSWTLRPRGYFQMIAFLSLFSILHHALYAETHAVTSLIGEPIALWSSSVPGETGDLGGEKLIERGGGLVRLTNVTKPTITVYGPGKGIKANGAAVLVCPGGGYNILAMSHEGSEVCEWLNQLGITAVLLKYRVPRREGLDKSQAPLQDAQRAMSLIRKNAKQWGIDPKKVGILGFSAGGHLATMVMSQYDKPRDYPLDAEIDSISSRPDFAVLIYPAYLQDEKDPDLLAEGIEVNRNTPPVFLLAANNDKSWAEGSAQLYVALKRAGSSAELHIFAKGGHGFGLKKTADRVAAWPQLCAEWLGELGLVNE